MKGKIWLIASLLVLIMATIAMSFVFLVQKPAVDSIDSESSKKVAELQNMVDRMQNTNTLQIERILELEKGVCPRIEESKDRNVIQCAPQSKITTASSTKCFIDIDSDLSNISQRTSAWTSFDLEHITFKYPDELISITKDQDSDTFTISLVENPEVTSHLYVFNLHEDPIKFDGSALGPTLSFEPYSITWWATPLNYIQRFADSEQCGDISGRTISGHPVYIIGRGDGGYRSMKIVVPLRDDHYQHEYVSYERDPVGVIFSVFYDASQSYDSKKEDLLDQLIIEMSLTVEPTFAEDAKG